MRMFVVKVWHLAEQIIQLRWQLNHIYDWQRFSLVKECKWNEKRKTNFWKYWNIHIKFVFIFRGKRKSNYKDFQHILQLWKLSNTLFRRNFPRCLSTENGRGRCPYECRSQMEATSQCAGGPWCPGPGSSPRPTASSTLTTGRSWSPLGPGTRSIGHWRSPGQSLCMWCIMGKKYSDLFIYDQQDQIFL